MKRPKIITRAKAIERGLPRYFTGKPCKYGHVAERYTLQSHCLECDRITSKEYACSPKGHETHRRYDGSPKGLMRRRGYNTSPLGHEAKRRFGDSSPRRHEIARKKAAERASVQGREKNARQQRERRLEIALDTTRDDFDPVRMYRLLALWNARR